VEVRPLLGPGCRLGKGSSLAVGGECFTRLPLLGHKASVRMVEDKVSSQASGGQWPGLAAAGPALAWIPTAPYELTLNSLAAALQLEFTCIS